MKNFWQEKKVLVTGGTGFIGSHLVEQLLGKGANVTIFDNLQKGKLKNIALVKNKIKLIQGDCTNPKEAFLASKNKDVVMNLAARVGGIEYNRTHQATMLRDNLLIATVMIEAARQAKVERFLVVSSACVYSNQCLVPTPESEGFLGEPEPTNGGYGWAKRVAELLGKYYFEEFGMKIAIVRPYNCYGPRDHFDPQTSHVIPALIKRIFDGEDPLMVWGHGEQSRAFLYVDDLARGMLETIEKYPIADPINLGTNEEIKIKDLIELLLRLSHKSPKVIFDKTKPAGQLRRNCDTKKAKEKIGFEAKIKLSEGLKRTIDWYRENLL